MQTPVFPGKHINMSESLVGIGAIILSSLENSPLSLDEIWRSLENNSLLDKRLHGSLPLDSVIITLDFLYCLGAIKLSPDGLVAHATD